MKYIGTIQGIQYSLFPVGRDPGTEDYICRGQDNPTGTHLIGKEMYRYYEGSYLAQKP